MAKPQPKPTRLQKMADKKNKVLTGPKGSKPQSTTNARSTKPSPKASIPSTTKAKPAAKPKAPTPKPQTSSSMKVMLFVLPLSTDRSIKKHNGKPLGPLNKPKATTANLSAPWQRDLVVQPWVRFVRTQ